jgi:hypothetical protein
LKLGRRLAVLLSPLVIGACGVVTVPEPLGDTAAVIQPGEWQGYWLVADPDGDYVVYAVVADGARGLLELSVIERDKESESPRAKLERREVILRHAGDRLIASMRETQTTTGYVFVALSKQRDAATLWIPDFECVEGLLKSGRLSGTQSTKMGSTIQLDRLDIAKALSRGSLDCDFFLWDKPLAIRRLTKR